MAATSRALNYGWRVPGYELKGNAVTFPKARAVECLPVAIDALQADVELAELAQLDEPDLIAPFVDDAASMGRAHLAVRPSEAGWVLEHGAVEAPCGARSVWS
ncbi:MAG: hypothetical protein AAFR53_12955 [Pseudomonadota bacterium]